MPLWVHDRHCRSISAVSVFLHRSRSPGRPGRTVSPERRRNALRMRDPSHKAGKHRRKYPNPPASFSIPIYFLILAGQTNPTNRIRRRCLTHSPGNTESLSMRTVGPTKTVNYEKSGSTMHRHAVAGRMQRQYERLSGALPRKKRHSRNLMENRIVLADLP